MMTHSDSLLRLSTLILIALLTALSAAASDGTAAFESRDFTQARTALEKEIKAAPDNAQLHYHLGRTYLALQNSKAAAKSLARAVELAPDNADMHFARGEANGVLASNVNILRAGGYAKLVRQSFERALEIDPQHTDALEGLIIYKLRAPKLLGGGKADALRMSEQLIDLSPIRGRIVRANTLQAMDRDEEAQTVLNELATRYADDPRAHVELGFIHQADKNYADAISHFHTASEGGTDTDEQRYARDMALYQLGRTAVFAGSSEQVGIDALRQYLTLDALDNGLPGTDWASFRLAELLGKAGHNEEAQALLQTALKTTDDKNLKRRLKAALK